MSEPKNPLVEGFNAVAQLHQKLAAEYGALACHFANAAPAKPATASPMEPPKDPPPAPLPGGPKEAPAAPPAAESSAPPPAAPPAAVPASGPSLADLIRAMQAHAQAKKASGGAIATLKFLKGMNKSWSTASSIPAEKRAEVIAALAADGAA